VENNLDQLWKGGNAKPWHDKSQRALQDNNISDHLSESRVRDANTAGLGKTATFQFPVKTTDKIRLTIYSTYDSGRRMNSDTLVPESRRAVFIREIIFRNEKTSVETRLSE
jgi:hypothetical protein